MCSFYVRKGEDDDGLFTRVTKPASARIVGSMRKDSHAPRGNMVTKTIPLYSRIVVCSPLLPILISFALFLFSSGQANVHVQQHRTPLLQCLLYFIYFIPLVNSNGKDQKDEKDERKTRIGRKEGSDVCVLGVGTPDAVCFPLSEHKRKKKEKEGRCKDTKNEEHKQQQGTNSTTADDGQKHKGASEWQGTSNEKRESEKGDNQAPLLRLFPAVIIGQWVRRVSVWCCCFYSNV